MSLKTNYSLEQGLAGVTSTALWILLDCVEFWLAAPLFWTLFFVGKMIFNVLGGTLGWKNLSRSRI